MLPLVNVNPMQVQHCVYLCLCTQAYSLNYCSFFFFSWQTLMPIYTKMSFQMNGKVVQHFWIGTDSVLLLIPFIHSSCCLWKWVRLCHSSLLLPSSLLTFGNISFRSMTFLWNALLLRLLQRNFWKHHYSFSSTPPPSQTRSLLALFSRCFLVVECAKCKLLSR